MNKLLKNSLFTFILGAIIFGTTGVIAATLLASNISYDNTSSGINANNVQDAISELYTKANTSYDEYNGSTTYTPNSNTQTISTNNKLMKSDITINPIPSNYKVLNGTANVDESKILNGYTAFNNNGELITGTVSTDCVSGSVVWSSNDVTNGRVIAQFKPSYLIVKEINNVIYYNKYLDENKILRTEYNNTDIFSATGVNAISKFGLTEWRVQITDQVKLTYDDNRLNETIYYMVCK